MGSGAPSTRGNFGVGTQLSSRQKTPRFHSPRTQAQRAFIPADKACLSALLRGFEKNAGTLAQGISAPAGHPKANIDDRIEATC